MPFKGPSCALQPDPQPMSPRRRRSQPRNDENAAPAPEEKECAHLSVNRFGFAARSPPQLPQKDVQQPDRAVEGLDLTRLVGECLGDFEAVVPLLKTKTGARKLDFNQAKAKVAELTDLVSQLKAALAELLKRARTLEPTLADAQKEANLRFRNQFETLGKMTRELEQLRSELSLWQLRADERGRKMQELRSECQSLEQRATTALQKAEHDSARATDAEHQVRSAT